MVAWFEKRWLVLCLCGVVVPTVSACQWLVEADPVQCESHSTCAELSNTSACIDSVCVELLTNECERLFPADILEAEDPILLGFVASDDDYGRSIGEGAELGFRDIAQTGLPGDRQLGAVMCYHDSSSGAEAIAAVRHLVHDVKVPAIIGSSYSGVTYRIANEVATRADVLVVSPSATSPVFTGLSDMVRRTTPSDVLQGELLKWLVEYVVDALVASGVIATREEARISLAVKPDAAGRGLQEAVKIEDRDRPNPAPALPGRQLDERETVNLAEVNIDEVAWNSYAQPILEFEPHVILGLGTEEFLEIMDIVEQQWSASWRPWYVLPEGNRLPRLAELGETYPDLSQRVVGTIPGARQSSLYDLFESSFRTYFGRSEPGTLAEFAYDTVYWVAYAIVLSGKQHPNGGQIASAMKKVTCKQDDAINPGLFTLFSSTASSLSPDSCFDMAGASGPLDFDSETGDADTDIAIWCLKKDTTGAIGFDPLLDSYYSIEENEVVRTDSDEVDGAHCLALDLANPHWCNPGDAPENEAGPDAGAAPSCPP